MNLLPPMKKIVMRDSSSTLDYYKANQQFDAANNPWKPDRVALGIIVI